MRRQDYAYPFHLAPASGRAAEADYPAHVAQMVRQALLTSPGERVNRPDFGAGLRRLVFAPNSEALRATAELFVRQTLAKFLAGHLTVRDVSVKSTPEEESLGQLVVTVRYELLEDRTLRQTDVRIT
jgi:phage baseplate assembly protein W